MKALKEVMSWIIPVIIGLAIAFAIKSFVFTRVRVEGHPWNRTSKQRKGFCLKQASVKHLSVIVFDAHGEHPSAKPNTNYVKRVIGLPGDTVTSKNGNLRNKKVDQGFISTSERTAGTELTLATLQKTQK